MRLALHFMIAAALPGMLALEPCAAQERAPALRLSAVGVGASNYAESLQFYDKVMGLRPAFSFSPTGKTMNTYLQLSRDTFLELQGAPTNAPGLTHIHMQTDDVDAVVARLRGAGVASCDEALKTGCLSGSHINELTGDKGAFIIDPSGIRFEPTQFLARSLTQKAVDSWNNQSPGGKLLVVGIAVKDYPASQTFYEQKLGFPVAFKFSSQDGKRTTTYYQISRDSFLEMQTATPEMPPGITHLHILTEDLNASIARLRQAGVASAARNTTTPNTVTEVGIAQPSKVRNASVFDPDGIRLELNELLPDSLTKKAMESWK